MSDLRDDLTDVRNHITAMLGPSDYRLPLDRFQPTEHERLMLLRLSELAEIVDRLAERVEHGER